MDAPPQPTTYNEFYAALMSEFDSLALLAAEKANIERMVTDPIPFMDAEPAGPAISDASDTLSRFASGYCYGDLAGIANLRSSIGLARTILNGDALPDDAPVAGYEGIDGEIAEITVGLASWENPTGRLFQSKYVNSIGMKKTAQYESLGKSDWALEAAERILIETRRAALQLPVDAREALSRYNPWEALWGGVDVTLTVIGITSGTIGSTLVEIVKRPLPTQSGLSVAGLMVEFQNAVLALRDAKLDGEADIKSTLSRELDQESSTWHERVCARPGDPHAPPGRGPQPGGPPIAV